MFAALENMIVQEGGKRRSRSRRGGQSDNAEGTQAEGDAQGGRRRRRRNGGTRRRRMRGGKRTRRR